MIVHGWCKGQLKAFRHKAKQPNENEYSKPIEVDNNWSKNDAIIAEFPDGEKWTVADLTVKKYEDLLGGRSSASKGELWSTSHAQTHNKIHISQRIDRDIGPKENLTLGSRLLVSVYEQSRQILQVRALDFGTLDGKDGTAIPNTHPTVQAALAFLQPLADGYAKGAIKIEDLKKMRDEQIKGLKQKTKQSVEVLKKPSVAPSKAKAASASSSAA